jgi:hypothetical protein
MRIATDALLVQVLAVAVQRHNFLYLVFFHKPHFIMVKTILKVVGGVVAAIILFFGTIFVLVQAKVDVSGFFKAISEKDKSTRTSPEPLPMRRLAQPNSVLSTASPQKMVVKSSANLFRTMKHGVLEQTKQRKLALIKIFKWQGKP